MTRNEGERAGIEVVLRAITEPLARIAANSGAEPAVVLGNVTAVRARSATTPLPGSMAISWKWLFLDPAKVTRTALQTAASVAGFMLMGG